MRLALMLPRPDTAGAARLARGAPDLRDGDDRRRTARSVRPGARPRSSRGQRADLVLLDPRTAGLAGSPVTVPHLVQHGGAAAVAAVMIDGVWVLRDGRMLAFDEAAVLGQVAAISSEVRAACRPGARARGGCGALLPGCR